MSKYEYTASNILGLYELRKTDTEEARIRELVKVIRELCAMKHTVYIPKTYQQITKPVKTPFFRDAWHTITSSMVSKNPVVHWDSVDDRKKGLREQASVAERWDQALLDRVNKELGLDLIYRLTSAVVRDGASVLKVVHKPDAWAKFPKGVGAEDQDKWKIRAGLPIAMCEVDRLQCLWEGGEYGDEWFMEYGEYSAPYLKSRYGMVESGGRMVNPYAVLDGRGYPEGELQGSRAKHVKIEFFTCNEWHVLVDGSEAPGFPKENPYSPHIPYFRAEANDSESLLYSLVFLVPRLDELMTMKMNWGTLVAYPNPVITTKDEALSLDMPMGDPGDVAVERQKRLTWTPGKVIELPPGKVLGFLEPPSTGKDLNDLIGILKSMIDVAGVAPNNRGQGFAGDSGYLAAQQRGTFEARQKQASNSCQRQLEEGLDFVHWMVRDVIGQTVYVKGWDTVSKKDQKPTKTSIRQHLGLSPDKSSDKVCKISNLAEIEVKYRPQLITDEQARAMIAIQMVNAPKPLWSRRHALEVAMQEEDADRIIDEIAVEDALDSEPLKSQWMAEAVREAGVEQPDTPQVDATEQGMSGMAGAPLPGVQGVPGATTPMIPPQPVGGSTPGGAGGQVPIGGGVASGGRPAGVYPGQPGGPGNG
jgi:hypothetical protein